MAGRASIHLVGRDSVDEIFDEVDLLKCELCVFQLEEFACDVVEFRAGQRVPVRLETGGQVQPETGHHRGKGAESGVVSRRNSRGFQLGGGRRDERRLRRLKRLRGLRRLRGGGFLSRGLGLRRRVVLDIKRVGRDVVTEVIVVDFLGEIIVLFEEIVHEDFFYVSAKDPVIDFQVLHSENTLQIQDVSGHDVLKDAEGRAGGRILGLGRLKSDVAFRVLKLVLDFENHLIHVAALRNRRVYQYNSRRALGVIRIEGLEHLGEVLADGVDGVTDCGEVTALSR